jgi:hypothetical protein
MLLLHSTANFRLDSTIAATTLGGRIIRNRIGFAMANGTELIRRHTVFINHILSDRISTALRERLIVVGGTRTVGVAVDG